MSQAGKLNDLTPPPGTTLFLETEDSVQVPPNGSGVIFVVGGSDIITSGNAGTNTVTINSALTPYDVTTTDDTPTLIATVTVDAGHAKLISCQFLALENVFFSAIGGNSFIVGRNIGLGAVLVGGAGGHQSIVYDSGGFPRITFGTSGSDVQIFVIGVAATTYNWRMLVNTLLL